MDRVMQHNVLAMSGKAVEAAGDINSLLLDKTGTITLGNRQAVEFLTINGVKDEELAMLRNFPVWRMKRRKDDPSWSWRKRNTDCEDVTSRSAKPNSSPSPPIRA